MGQANRFVIATWVLLGLFALTVVDWLFGGMRFVSLRANLLVSLAALWLPVACVALLGFLPRSRRRAWAFAALIPTALVCLPLGSVFILGQTLFLWTRQSTVRLGHSEVVTYYTDAGAWDSGGTVIQQEITLLPGLLWVKPLSSVGYTRDVSVMVLDRHHIRCAYAFDKNHPDAPQAAAQRDDAWVF